MNYSEALAYLDGLQSTKIELGLERISAACKALGHPERKFPSVHVAGTNGKGSTCAFLESIFRSHGRKTGFFTSPHLTDVRERIQIDREMISKDDFARISSGIGSRLTYFEFLTAVGFQYFAEQNVDIAVIEVGLGGRFDSTNIIVPTVSVITRIGMDHQGYLGDTIEKVAFEKAGIIKEGVPVVTIYQEESAMNVIREVADQKHAMLHVVSPHEVKYELGLLGKHQYENAALALRASELALPLCKGELEGVDMFSSPTTSSQGRGFEEALASVKWPGRLEMVSKRPLVILDGAHNPNGAEALARFIREIERTPPLGHSHIIVMLGIMADKDIDGIIRPLAEVADELILTRPSGSRAADPNELKNMVPTFRSGSASRSKDRDYITVIEPLHIAIEQTLKTMSENSVLIIAGSLYTVGEARDLILGQNFLGKR